MLVVDAGRLDSDGLFVVAMAPDPTLGGALAGVGARVPLSWADLRLRGLDALLEAGTARTTAPNLDWAPRSGALRGRKTVFVEVDDRELRLGPQGSGGKGAGTRQRTTHVLPVSPADLCKALSAALGRAGW